MAGIALILCLGLACMDRHGVIGAIFRLNDESPLPSWLHLPQEVNRDSISITITRYEVNTSPKWKCRFTVRNKGSGRMMLNVIGYGSWHPDSERHGAPAIVYPNWVVIEVDGIKEVYEQSGSNDLLKIVKK